MFFILETFFIPACFYYFCNMKFSLIFPLPTSSDWKNGLTKKEIKKIIRSNDKRLESPIINDKRLKDDAKIK